MRSPKAPMGTGPSGRKLWSELHSRFEFDEETEALIREAVRVVDRLDALQVVVQRDGVMSPTDPGKVHPALAEARQQEIVLTRLIASLRLPDQAGATDQRRGGARGAYKARGAANVRWHGAAAGLGA